MKKINKFLLIVAITIGFASCSNWIDTDLNVDPDAPSKVPLKFMLPTIQANMAYELGGNDLVRTTHIWMQFFDGIARQSFNEGGYTYKGADCNNLWNSIYATILADAKLLAEEAEAQGSPHFKGVAQILTAVTLAHTTDLWGDIPYSEALDPENRTPKLDAQQSIYVSIQTLLDDAIVNLSKTDNAIALSGDMMFGGNTARWIKAANALKARYTLQLSEVNGNAAATQALTYLAAALADNSDNFKFNFGNNPSEYNPIKQFMDQRSGDIAMSSTFIDRLNATSDPRRSFYATAVGGAYIGSEPGSQSDPAAVSAPGTFIASGNSPVYFMTFAEQKFIEAEANFRLGNLTPALDAYKAAVAASVLLVTGNANTAWLDANINNETTATLTLEKIMVQKATALYGQLQPYNDFRRTGFPSDLKKPINAPNNIPPVRYPYPEEEKTYNPNIPDADLTDNLWWDK